MPATGMGQYEKGLPGYRIIMANRHAIYAVSISRYLKRLSRDYSARTLSFFDYLFPAEAAAGTGNPHRQRRRIRTWLRNQ